MRDILYAILFAVLVYALIDIYPRQEWQMLKPKQQHAVVLMGSMIGKAGRMMRNWCSNDDD